MRCLVSAVPLLVVLGFASVGQAVGVAPRISDREIIESLVELKVGQQALQLGLDIPVIKGVVIEEQDVEVGLTSREYWP